MLKSWRSLELILLTGLLSSALASCTPGPEAASVQAASAGLIEQCSGACVATVLLNAAGDEVGEVTFSKRGETTLVALAAHLPAAGGEIRGLHIHANDKPENGEGCIADPKQPASTHFVSADGHFNPGGDHHGEHGGDMPAVFFTHAGDASMQFSTDRFRIDDLPGLAVILHERADNYGNIPVGSAATDYMPNTASATELTQNTGNGGARIACGIIE